MYWLRQMGVLSQIAQRPCLAYYFAQKAIRHPFLRRWSEFFVTRLIKLRHPIHSTSTESNELLALKKDGITFLPKLNLAPSVISEVLGHFKNKPVVDLYSGVQLPSIENLQPRYNKLHYQIEDTLTCKPLIDLANHPEILATVGRYLGVTPSIASMQAWWTYGEHSAYGQKHYDDVYHRDVDDFRFVKLFVYLTDTTAKTGAHSYIKGSHLSPLLNRRGPITDEQVMDSFNETQFITVTGVAGTVFLEDTWGIHRPLLATEGRRLVFYVLYSLVPFAPHGMARPLLPLPSGLDSYVNRSYFYTPA
jgi:Phytanoyl-CoA dioxygenase (PhyH)